MQAPRHGSLERLRWPLLLLGAALLYGVIGYRLIEGWSFVDSLYMTLLVLTTVGFSEVHTLDLHGKLFTMSLMIIGVALVLVTVSLVAGWVAERALGSGRRRKKMNSKIERLQNHFIVCAYGRVGRAVAREFEAEGVPFVVCEVLEDIESQMQLDGVAYILGDPSKEPILTAAGVGRAKGLICAVDSDATNVYIALLARSMNPDLFIVARAAEPGSADRLYRAGADRVISPYVSSGRHMAMLSLRPKVVDYLEVDAGTRSPLTVEEMLIDRDSPLANKPIIESCGLASVLAIRQADGRIVANPSVSTTLREGDLILLLGEREALRPMDSH